MGVPATTVTTTPQAATATTIPALAREVLAVQAVLVPTLTTAMARLDGPVVREETLTVILRLRDVREVSVPIPTTAMDRQAAPEV